MTELDLLRLLQLADSALPIGAAAHSFGLETLTAEEVVGPAQLRAFIRDYLDEAGMLEAVACRAAFAGADFAGVNEDVNEVLSATKQARESRVASAALGKRFLRLVFDVCGNRRLAEALETAEIRAGEIHSSPAFGLAGAVLGLDEEAVVAACLRSMVAAMVSAAQRLLPLGQTAASILLWESNVAIASLVERSRGVTLADACCFAPMLDCASMRHPGLSTRLFIS